MVVVACVVVVGATVVVVVWGNVVVVGSVVVVVGSVVVVVVGANVVVVAVGSDVVVVGGKVVVGEGCVVFGAVELVVEGTLVLVTGPSVVTGASVVVVTTGGRVVVVGPGSVTPVLPGEVVDPMGTVDVVGEKTNPSPTSSSGAEVVVDVSPPTTSPSPPISSEVRVPARTSGSAADNPSSNQLAPMKAPMTTTTVAARTIAPEMSRPTNTLSRKENRRDEGLDSASRRAICLASSSGLELFRRLPGGNRSFLPLPSPAQAEVTVAGT